MILLAETPINCLTFAFAKRVDTRTGNDMCLLVFELKNTNNSMSYL